MNCTSLSDFTSPACGGGRIAKRSGWGQFYEAVQAAAPTPTFPRKRGREKKDPS